MNGHSPWPLAEWKPPSVPPIEPSATSGKSLVATGTHEGITGHLLYGRSPARLTAAAHRADTSNGSSGGWGGRADAGDAAATNVEADTGKAVKGEEPPRALMSLPMVGGKQKDRGRFGLHTNRDSAPPSVVWREGVGEGKVRQGPTSGKVAGSGGRVGARRGEAVDRSCTCAGQKADRTLVAPRNGLEGGRNDGPLAWVRGGGTPEGVCGAASRRLLAGQLHETAPWPRGARRSSRATTFGLVPGNVSLVRPVSSALLIQQMSDPIGCFLSIAPIVVQKSDRAPLQPNSDVSIGQRLSNLGLSSRCLGFLLLVPNHDVSLDTIGGPTKIATASTFSV